MKKPIKVSVKAKATVKALSPWRCVVCAEPVETPEELAANPANLPVHKKCLFKMKEAEQAGTFTPRTESISENGTPEAPD